jgi:hypothetical protein
MIKQNSKVFTVLFVFYVKKHIRLPVKNPGTSPGNSETTAGARHILKNICVLSFLFKKYCIEKTFFVGI